MQERQRSNTLLQVMGGFVGISGCFSVLFGAWLAHADFSDSHKVYASLSTALQYQFIHTLALLAIVLFSWHQQTSKILTCSMLAFVLGILLFCGNIYIKSLFDIQFLGKLTPIGGMSLAFAWLLLAFEGKNNL